MTNQIKSGGLIMYNDETMKQIAKAGQMLSKPITDIIEFLRNVLAPIEQAGLAGGDFVARYRARNAVTLGQHIKSALASADLTVQRPIPERVCYEILDGATNEEDPELQRMWAHLLVNAANPKSDVEVERWQAGILRQLSPFDAKVLKSIILAPDDVIEASLRSGGMWLHRIPDGYTKEGEGTGFAPPPHVQTALWNLVRLGCITDVNSFPNNPLLYIAMPTMLGIQLVKSCEPSWDKQIWEAERDGNGDVKVVDLGKVG